MFAVGLCVLWVLCGPSKATARCYTSICVTDNVPLLSSPLYLNEAQWTLQYFCTEFKSAVSVHSSHPIVPKVQIKFQYGLSN